MEVMIDYKTAEADFRAMQYTLMRIAPCLTCKHYKCGMTEQMECMIGTTLPRNWEFDRDALLMSTPNGYERINYREDTDGKDN